MAHRPRSFLVWGAGGHGRVVGELVLLLGHRLCGFVDQDPQKLGRKIMPDGAAVVCLESELLTELQQHGRYPDGIDALALGTGDNRVRFKCLEAIRVSDVPTLVHPSATISLTAEIGQGTVVLPNAIVHTGATIDEGVIVNSGAIVEHDCVLGPAVHVSPGATLCGGVKIGPRSWIGAGATVVPGVRIGSDVIVGAGSLVIRDVNDGDTVVGSPAHSRTR